MTQLVNVKPEESGEKGLFFCRELEKGNILFFLKTPFSIPEEIEEYFSRKSKLAAHEIQKVLESYSMKVTEFLSQLLPAYAARWKPDKAVFRPFQKQVQGEKLQVDAFAARPLHGWRVLRFFTNIHPTEGKRWATSKSFAELAQEFAGKVLPFPKSCTHSLGARLERKMKELLASAGLKGALRSPYDQFMLRLQRFLRQNEEFQVDGAKIHWDFPPGSSWVLFTDQVSHAALSGLHALEQMFLIPTQALLYPDQAPISILERLSKGNMADPAVTNEGLSS